MIYPITSQIISIQGVASSMQGGRPENQDDWGIYDTPLGCLLIVCDGMGGGPGGKTASYIVKTVIATTLQGCSPQTSRIDALKRAVSMANDALYQKMDDTPSLRGMGSTMVSVLINAHSAVVAHLGDSRCYRIGNGRVVFRTDDHSLVGELVRNKAMTEEQARVSPQSNVITRGLGNTSNHVPELIRIPYRKGDRFILCTDGVWGIMPHEQLEQRLTSQQEIQSLVSNLAAEVDQRGFAAGGQHDNHTLVAIEMQTDSILKDKMSKKLKMILGALGALLALSLVFNIVCLVKLGALPKIAALEQENQDLKTKMALYQDVNNSDAKDLITKAEILRYEKELLEESQAELIAKVDSLEKVVEGYQQQIASAAKEKSSQTLVPKTATAKELAQRSLNLFDKMLQAKGKTRQEAAKLKAEYRRKIVEQLLMLDKKTEGKYTSKIAGINRELQHPDPLTDKVGRNIENKSEEEYISTDPAKKEIQKLIKKVEEIKKQLK